MKKIEINLLSETTNCPVVQMPGRKFPGTVIQGDSMSNLLALVLEIEELASQKDYEEMRDTLKLLKDKLEGYLAHYKEALGEHHIPLPY